MKSSKSIKRALLQELRELEMDECLVSDRTLFYHKYDARYDDYPRQPSNSEVTRILDKAEEDVKAYIKKRQDEISIQLKEIEKWEK